MKYAIVTGGARGLGLGIVNALFEEKVVVQVAVIDLELAPPPAAIASRVQGFTADVTDEKQVHQALEAIAAKLGPHPDVHCLYGVFQCRRGRACLDHREQKVGLAFDRAGDRLGTLLVRDGEKRSRRSSILRVDTVFTRSPCPDHSFAF